jgi:hypothetical protein
MKAEIVRGMRLRKKKAVITNANRANYPKI